MGSDATTDEVLSRTKKGGRVQGPGLEENVKLGKWTREALDRLIAEASAIPVPGERIEYLSRQFLGIPYGASTLIGNASTPEAFVINLEAVDCFTFLDYVETLRLVSAFEEFAVRLREVRYRDGLVSFSSRNHFFTDWAHVLPSVRDVTREAGGGFIRTVTKLLNVQGDGSLYLPGIEPRQGAIDYIPAARIKNILGGLHVGDYIGIFADVPGLDVTHVGIFVQNNGQALFRHASSAANVRCVVDQPFLDYVADKPGIIVLRPVT
jgi:hypothetical protein